MQFDKLESQLDLLYQLQIETAAEIQSKRRSEFLAPPLFQKFQGKQLQKPVFY